MTLTRLLPHPTTIAKIDYHYTSSSKIRYGGQEMKSDKFFRKEGWSWNGRGRVFTWPDGKEYVWKMKDEKCVLYWKGNKETPAVHPNPKPYYSTWQDAYLEYDSSTLSKQLPPSTAIAKRCIMHLYLTSNSPWNATYRTESGQVIYKAESRGLLGPRHITISKIQPARTIDLDANGKVPEEALRDAFTEIGMVEWHAVTYSKIRVGDGEEVSVKDFFRKEGWGSYGVKGYMGRGRVFTGPDGKEYVWKMDSTKPKLYTFDKKDENETLVTNFHQQHFGLIGKARPASLEIQPEFNHMSDIIVITLIYIEKLRREKERQNSGGGD